MQGARNSTNQRRVSVDQSEPSSQNATRGTNSTSICERTSLAKIRPYRLVVEIRMPFLRNATRGHSTAAPARDSSNQSRPPDMRRRHVLRAHRRVRVLWRWVQGAPDSTNQCERARDSTNQSSPPGMQRAVRSVRSPGHECHFARAQSGDIRRWRPIRAVLPACNARHSIKGTAPSFLRISFSDRYQQHVDL